MTNNYQMDMCHGALFGKIVRFSLPLMISYILQLLFHAADLMVIGHYAAPEAMAAVGVTGTLNSFVLSIFIGLSIGTNVVVAKSVGAHDHKAVARSVHTSVAIAFYGGLILMVVGLLSAKPILVWMDTPPEILPKACLYICICFCAIPMLMLYNFGCAILRAVGDTRRPLYFLIIAGIVNVLLNLFFVIVCGMEVGGVALATAISHGVSAMLIVHTLTREPGSCRLDLRHVIPDWKSFCEILKVGIPAGVQSSCFAISNMIIWSSINSFGAYAMAGITAESTIEGIMYVCVYSFHQTAISFVAQNLGGHRYKRILKSIVNCILSAMAVSIVMGLLFLFFGRPLLAIFNPDPEVIEWGFLRMKIICTTYFFCGIMDVTSGGLRGLGYSMLSALITVFGTCVFRIIWVYLVFPHFHSMENLILSYPISWALAAAVNGGFLYLICKRMINKQLHHRISVIPS